MNRSKRGVKKSTTSSAGYDLPKHFGDFRQMMHTFVLNVGVLERARNSFDTSEVFFCALPSDCTV